jgi:hypothetical protein
VAGRLREDERQVNEREGGERTMNTVVGRHDVAASLDDLLNVERTSGEQPLTASTLPLWGSKTCSL